MTYYLNHLIPTQSCSLYSLNICNNGKTHHPTLYILFYRYPFIIFTGILSKSKRSLDTVQCFQEHVANVEKYQHLLHWKRKYVVFTL